MAGPLRKKELFLTFFSKVSKFQRPLKALGGRGVRPLWPVIVYTITAYGPAIKNLICCPCKKYILLKLAYRNIHMC